MMCVTVTAAPPPASCRLQMKGQRYLGYMIISGSSLHDDPLLPPSPIALPILPPVRPPRGLNPIPIRPADHNTALLGMQATKERTG